MLCVRGYPEARALLTLDKHHAQHCATWAMLFSFLRPAKISVGTDTLSGVHCPSL